MIISPSWEQSIDFMIKDSPIRLSDKIFRFNFKIISTRTLRKFIPDGSARHAITKEYFIESGKTQINQKLFPLQRILLWTSHCEQDCPRVKKVKGRPSYQAQKNNRRVLWNSCRTTSNTRHFLCWHSCGDCGWDWSKYVTTTIANFYEVSFLSLLTSTDHFRKESRAS